MATVTFDHVPTYVARPAAVELAPVNPATTARPSSEMHADDTAALRIVSVIIFTVVALGTLTMLGTVLFCG